jgi:hypothetical protein
MTSKCQIGATAAEEASGNADASASSETPYGVEEFAAKHQLTLSAAKAVLVANGPSRHKSDAGARAFLFASSLHRRLSRKF